MNLRGQIMLRWLRRAALRALRKGKEKKKQPKRDILAPTIRTKAIQKKLRKAGLTEKEIEKLTGAKARRSLARNARKK